VIEDGGGKLIDLAGVMGGNLSAVDASTKNVLLFVQTYNPINIRKTSMSLAQRTLAATIFEKGTDPELVTQGILMGIKLFSDIAKGTAEKGILDIYPNPYKAKKVATDLNFIETRLGVSISKKEISETLNALEFETKWSGDKLDVWVSSFRARDFETEEDVLEEIARIYGYHNLPSKLMEGPIPEEAPLKQFTFEKKVKDILAGWGGVEVYTLSLVSDKRGLKLKNPLGSDTEYLRTSLMPSLINAAKTNIGTFEKFHLFEMANIYLPRKNDLPEERLILAGIFEGYGFRNAKGIIEAFLTKLRIEKELVAEETEGFSAGKSLVIKDLGKFGIVENSNLIYYEVEVSKLFDLASENIIYKEIPKYPAQVEDITLAFPEKTKIGDVKTSIASSDTRVGEIEYVGDFKGNHTFHIKYQDPNKTLTNDDVQTIRNKILQRVKEKFGGAIKE
jgi:phenylalanyl-tRNA synthetase beta chain